MSKNHAANRIFHMPSVIRRFLLAWLSAVTIEYIMLPVALKDLQQLAGLAEMSMGRVVIMMLALFAVLCLWNKVIWERWIMVAVFFTLASMSLVFSFTIPFLIIDLLILIILVIYALNGWNSNHIHSEMAADKSTRCIWVTVSAAVLFFLFVSIWTVCRVLSFSTPTFDFGIFSQMFYNMKTEGLPFTTVERDGLLSHFHVHFSPIYYLLLPVYCIFPYPVTLQVLQAAVLASAVIPLWLIGKKHNLNPVIRMLLCLLLLLFPAYAGGTSYDIHENAFLTPTILWLFYGFDRKSIPVTVCASVLVLMVKEDAPVYVAIIALYYLLHGILYKDKWELYLGGIVTVAAVIWFIAVTAYLAQIGDGVMTYRYNNFMFDGSKSLLTVIKAVLLCPMKAVFESVDQEKLQFIAYTILPLAALPLVTRRYERYLLLVPYILVNLMSDYQYQHSFFFQYTYGSTACLFYLVAVNLADIRPDFRRIILLVSALMISVVCFTHAVVPKAIAYPRRYQKHQALYAQMESTLSLIPSDASVSATTFYTTYLSQRSVLYDIKYASDEHIFSTDYVVLAVSDDAFEPMSFLLEGTGYTVFAQLEGTLVIYQRPS